MLKIEMAVRRELRESHKNNAVGAKISKTPHTGNQQLTRLGSKCFRRPPDLQKEKTAILDEITAFKNSKAVEASRKNYRVPTSLSSTNFRA